MGAGEGNNPTSTMARGVKSDESGRGIMRITSDEKMAYISKNCHDPSAQNSMVIDEKSTETFQ